MTDALSKSLSSTWPTTADGVTYFPRIAVVISREFIASASSHFGGSSCCGVRISEAVSSSQRASKEWISR